MLRLNLIDLNLKKMEHIKTIKVIKNTLHFLGVPIFNVVSEANRIYSISVLSVFTYCMLLAQSYHLRNVFICAFNSEEVFDALRAFAILFVVAPVAIKLPFLMRQKRSIFGLEDEMIKLSEGVKCRTNTQAWDLKVYKHYCWYSVLPYFTVLSTTIVSIASFHERKLGHNIWIPFNHQANDMQFILAVIISTVFGAHQFIISYNIDFILISYISILKGISLDFLKTLSEQETPFDVKNTAEFLQKIKGINEKLNMLFSFIYLPHLAIASIVLGLTIFCCIVVCFFYLHVCNKLI